MRLTTSGVSSTNTPTFLTCGTASTMRAACSGSTKRWLRRQKMKPMKSAPAPSAARAAPTVFIPHNFALSIIPSLTIFCPHQKAPAKKSIKKPRRADCSAGRKIFAVPPVSNGIAIPHFRYGKSFRYRSPLTVAAVPAYSPTSTERILVSSRRTIHIAYHAVPCTNRRLAVGIVAVLLFPVR